MGDSEPAAPRGRILLIDDDPALGGYLTRVLTRGGFEVTHELDSVSALRRVEAQDWDLLITDIELPGMSGTELLERIQLLQPGLPVAVMTAHAAVDDSVAPEWSPTVEFMGKPVPSADLLSRVGVLIARGRAIRSVV